MALIMFDFENSDSFNNVKNYLRDIKNICGNIPVIICGNKCFSYDKEEVQIDDARKFKYFDIDVYSNYNIDKSITYLINKYMNNNSNLEIINE